MSQLKYYNPVTQQWEPAVIGKQGEQGPPGPQGPQGIPGVADTTSFSQVFEQQVISSTWTINHNLGYRPAVFVRDYGNNNLECDVQHSSASSLTLNFLSENTGYAYLT